MKAPTNPRKCVLSDDAVYRYLLTESWSGLFRGVSLTWCMLNPSTADQNTDDRTVIKIRGFTNRLGFNGFQIVNLFAYRSPDPSVMRRYHSPVGPLNDAWIKRAAMESRYVMCGWGNDGSHLDRAEKVIGDLRCAGIKMMCLGFTGSGAPLHPLYVPYENKLEEIV